MINLKKRLDKDGESGEIMLESVIVLLLTLAILFAMFSLGFLYYQKVMIQTIANEATAYAATNYKYSVNREDDVDIVLNDTSVTQDETTNLKMFRATFSKGALKRSLEEKTQSYIEERVEQSSFGINGTTKGTVIIDKFDIVTDNIGRMHVVCEVSVKCEVLFGGFLEFLELVDNSMITFSASSRAEVIDITSYASYNNFVRYFGERLRESMSNVDSICNSIGTIIDKLGGLFN